MNIIYMHTHDSGRYTSPYGYNLPTPNIMKLAEDGVLFRSAYSAAPDLLAEPRRAALWNVRSHRGYARTCPPRLFLLRLQPSHGFVFHQKRL